jgi:hypothetical protein
MLGISGFRTFVSLEVLQLEIRLQTRQSWKMISCTSEVMPRTSGWRRRRGTLYSGVSDEQIDSTSYVSASGFGAQVMLYPRKSRELRT